MVDILLQISELPLIVNDTYHDIHSESPQKEDAFR